MSCDQAKVAVRGISRKRTILPVQVRGIDSPKLLAGGFGTDINVCELSWKVEIRKTG